MYSVGYAEGNDVDISREHWRENRPRPLAWASWYPADGRDKETPSPQPTITKDAQLSTQQVKFPVVLLSHGTGGRAQGLSWLGTRLAEQGFISIAVSHHGNNCTEPYLAEGFLCWWERARDLSTVIDLLTCREPFVDRLDTSAISAVGFSLGGYTVLSLLGALTNYDLFKDWLASKQLKDTGPKEFPNLSQAIPELMEQSKKFRQSMERQGVSYRDHRIKSAVALAPAPTIRAFEPASLKSISVSVGIMVGQDDKEAAHQDCAVWLKEQNPRMTLELLEKNVGHYVFLPEATPLDLVNEPDIFRDPEGVNRRDIHDRATRFVLATISSP
ncbi:alpha/beta hydrolase family protein [Kiloniella antarctica]|uniref:Alpha/beta hydrolase family protein n=1 Tax=Kiloniella antarctica TaxID=1550907 RepID=A0ABW5BIC6_9PROT